MTNCAPGPSLISPPDAATAAAAALSLAGAAEYAFIATDVEGRITFVNDAAHRLFGYDAGEMAGASIDLIIPERFHAAHAAGMARIAASVPSKLAGKTVEVIARRKSGEEFPAEFSLSVWRDSFGVGAGAIMRDISEWRARDNRLLQLAHYDPLTGLINRARFEELLDAALDSGGHATVLMIDLDGFKEVNDSWGHATGDAVLQMVAIRLAGKLTNGGSLARFGGDEFAVLMPGSADPLEAADCAKTILDGFSSPFVIDGRALYLGASIGGAVGRAHGDSSNELIGNADLALFRAKQDGKRRFHLFEPVMRSALTSRLILQDDLRRAVAGGEFVLHYQPQVMLATKRIFGAEALLRWRHPRFGLLMPQAFISELEEHPVAAEVGRWIIDEACRQTSAWRAAGLPPIIMGVNLFKTQVRNGTLSTDLAQALEKHRLSPEALELEITETIALQVNDAVLGTFNDLFRQGFGIAFDDFGTGYASLSSLKRFPLTRLKIDRTFVRDLITDPHDTAVVRAVIQIGRDIGLGVIAEGVETEEQEALLLSLGCEQGQGYRYSKAVTVPMFARLFEFQGQIAV